MFERVVGWLVSHREATEIRRRIAAMHRSLDIAEQWIGELAQRSRR